MGWDGKSFALGNVLAAFVKEKERVGKERKVRTWKGKERTWESGGLVPARKEKRRKKCEVVSECERPTFQKRIFRKNHEKTHWNALYRCLLHLYMKRSENYAYDFYEN